MERLSDKQEHDIVNYGECFMHNKVEKFNIVEQKDDTQIVNDWYNYHSTLITAKQLSNGNVYSFQYDYLVENS